MSSSGAMFSAITLIGLVFLVILVILVVLSVKFKSFGKIIGAILSIAGLAAILFGIVRANSFQSQFSRAFGASDDAMVLCFVLGGISTVLGIILFVVGNSGNKTPVVNFQAAAIDNPTVHVVKVRCPKCQALNDELSKFCKSCGNPIINEKAEI